jgi:CubicO group peptidase (beta-lactamase class C family)
MEPGPNGRSASSLTWAGLLNTYYWIDPTKRVAAVFMTQVLPFADRPALSLYHQFERGIYGAVNAARSSARGGALSTLEEEVPNIQTGA